MESPSFLVRLLHSVPHVNITFQRVNDTFDLKSSVYKESLGILASIPAAILILSLVGLLLYLLTRCCDRKPRKSKSQACQKCTLITVTLFCCAAIGLGLYGNDDFHNGLLQVFSSRREVKGLISNFTNKTDRLKHDISTKILIPLDIFDGQTYNQTARDILFTYLLMVKENTTNAGNALNTVSFLARPVDKVDSLKQLLDPAEFYESIRWPATLGFLTVLLFLCTILVIGVARNSRCALIFFSVLGLFGVIICWLLSGIYLASSVAVGDFCMRPNEYLCRHVSVKRLDDINYLNCGTLRNRFIIRLNESRDNIDRARDAYQTVARASKILFPGSDMNRKVEQIDRELSESKQELINLTRILDRHNVEKNYVKALRGVCSGGLLGLSLMMIASLATALLLTILVCVDSHTWIYLSKKRPYIDHSETTPFLSSTASTVSPTVPIMSGTSTINRTLLHHQQPERGSAANIPGTVSVSRNGSTLRGFGSGESPPPDYNIVVHDHNRMSGHQTLGRLPSQQYHGSYSVGPNNGKYATLSKQCKTLESNDCY